MAACNCGQRHAISAYAPSGHAISCPAHPQAPFISSSWTGLREAIVAALSAPVPSRPGVPVVRIWARDRDDAQAGAEANLWAGTPADVADLILTALTEEPA